VLTSIDENEKTLLKACVEGLKGNIEKGVNFAHNPPQKWFAPDAFLTPSHMHVSEKHSCFLNYFTIFIPKIELDAAKWLDKDP
jgi:hypothetical protein